MVVDTRAGWSAQALANKSTESYLYLTKMFFCVEPFVLVRS